MRDPHPGGPRPRKVTALPRALAIPLLVLLALATVARAQDDAPADATIELRADRVFLDSGARPGDVLPIRVQVRDLGLEARDIVVRVLGEDPDGDVPRYERVVSTNVSGSVAGVKPTWLYVPLPRDYAQGSPPLIITAHPAASDGSAAADTQLGRLEYAPSQVISPYDGLILVVGNRDYDLTAYQAPAGPGDPFPTRAHELTRVITGIAPADMPDRWHGWHSVEALVWGGSGSAFGPGSLLQVQAEAIEHWVRRGGHLVVILGADTQVWTSRTSNRLRDLLPPMAHAPIEHEGVDLAPWLALLTGNDAVPLPDHATVRELTPDPDAAPGESTPVLLSPEGWCVALRRDVGAGAVTVIGLDLADAQFRRPGTLDATVFWHRVLGRRGDVMSEAELRNANLWVDLPNRRMSTEVLDAGVTAFIAKSGRSIQGLFFAIIIFAVYWVLAGPGGFALLAKWKRKQHAWVAFVAVTAACTLVAWTTALALRPKRVEVTQLTLLEMVYGQPTARAKAWASVLVPRYGRARIGVGADDARGAQDAQLVGTNLIGVWRPPPGAGSVQSFPDNAAYTVASAAPDAIPVVTRSTVKQVVAEWAGTLPEGVGIRPYATPGNPQELRAVRLPTGRWSVTGTIVHDLPTPLEDVQIVAVLRQDPLTTGRAKRGDDLVSSFSVRARSLVGDWEPGKPVRLEDVFNAESTTPVLSEGEELLRGFVPRTAGVQGIAVSGPDALDGLRASLFYPALPPWDVREKALAKLVRRAETHGWDLGRWFTQPCVIVVGVMHDTRQTDPLVPITVDGRPAAADGSTLVAWVYPLAGDPPAWPTNDPTTNDPTTPDTPPTDE